jgi:glucosamine--fructose-6-phosphate aminotransferase (isomerizing)
MCGIVGYVGERSAVPILIEMLEQLEYRGYDSAGVAVLTGGKVWLEKTPGRIATLKERLVDAPTDSHTGMGHTRWATHGEPNYVNAHPHLDDQGQVVIVHNGIIENYARLKARLSALGHVFCSQTDTEVMAHLVAHYYDGNLVAAACRAIQEAEGAFALGIMHTQEPDKLIVVRQNAPLVVGLGQGENFVASDIPALLNYTRHVHILEDGEMAVITRDDVTVTDFQGRLIAKPVMMVDWTPERARKDGFPHFLLKEIHEQPRAISETLRGRLGSDGQVDLEEAGISDAVIQGVERVHFLACGTAAHAGALGKHLFERLLRIPCDSDIGSEFRYREPILAPNTLVVAISQSGETADTIASVQLARSQGAKVLAMANVVGSTIPRLADGVLYTRAGPEIAVPSTKAFLTQLTCLYLLALRFAAVHGGMAEEVYEEIVEGLRKLPRQVQAILDDGEAIAAVAGHLVRYENCFVLGRVMDEPIAREGALKLKEIAYIHAEAQPAGELKHGSITLIYDGLPVIALATQGDTRLKMISNIQEVLARRAYVIAIIPEGEEEAAKIAQAVIRIPRTSDWLAPVLAAVPLQLLGYYAGVARGVDVDKPKNLAKSVTVE